MLKREIKFRAWIHDENNVIDGYMDDHVFIWNDDEIWIDGDVVDIDGCIEVMQYSGLKDKNCEEIYEGDIVTCRHFIENGVIEYLYSSFYVKYELGWMILSTAKDIEIIGNIYENPELL